MFGGKMKKLVFLVSIMLVFAMLTVTGCKTKSQSTVQTYTIVKRNITNSVTLSGVLSYDPETSVVSSVSGKVLQVYVKGGDTVKNGDVIAEIDSTSAKNNYENALINYQISQMNYLISEASLKDLDTSLDQAKTNLETAQLSYEITKLNVAISEQTDNSELQLLQAQQQYKNAEINLASAEANLEVLKAPSDDNISSAEIQVKNAQTSLALAQQNLRVLKESDTQEEGVISAEEQLRLAKLNLENAQKKLDEAAKNSNTADSEIESLQNQIISAQINVKSAERNLEKAKNPLPSTEDEIKQAEYQVEAAEINLKSAIQNYNDQINSAENALELATMNCEIAKANLDIVTNSSSLTAEESHKSKELQMKQAEITLKNATTSLESTRRQIETGKLKLEEQKLQSEQSNKALQILKNSLEDYIIKSPIEGLVISFNLEEGVSVSANSMVATIGNTSKFISAGYADEIDAVDIKVDQSVMVSFDAFPNVALKGTVKTVGITKVSAPQGTSAYKIEVEIQAPKEELNLKSGLATSLEIETARKENVIAVPIESILTTGGKSYVEKIMSDGTTQRTEVQTGISGGTFTEILSGLNEGDKILLIPEESTSTTTSTGNKNIQIPGIEGGGVIPGGEIPGREPPSRPSGDQGNPGG
jgi:HlyD family secretion protein